MTRRYTARDLCRPTGIVWGDPDLPLPFETEADLHAAIAAGAFPRPTQPGSWSLYALMRYVKDWRRRQTKPSNRANGRGLQGFKKAST